MEEGKQSKKNRKKKNKQKKAAEDAASSLAHTSSQQQDNNASDTSHSSQLSETTFKDSNASDPSHLAQPIENNNNPESHSNGINEFIVDNSSGRDIGSNGPVLETGEKQNWIKEEARLKMMIKELQIETEFRIQKEAELESKLAVLQEERDVSRQKEAELETELSRLQEEKDVSRQKEITFEDKISQLTQEKDTLCMKESNLLEKVKHFEVEKDLWVREEINFEDKISQLMQEKDTLCLKESNLLEKCKRLEVEKDLWVREEDSNRQKIAALNDENARLRAQVTELDERGNKLLLEKQQLMENLAALQSRMDDLERVSASAQSSADNINDASKVDELNCQIEAAFQLVERLITENADTVEKMNELYAELGRWQAEGQDFTVTVPDSHIDSESGNALAVLAENANRIEEVLNEEERFVSDQQHIDYSAVMQSSSETNMHGEIVQIPLDENEARDLEGQASVNENTDGIPLTDAPLIGAPFRLISVMARYVSGADLVRDDSESAQ